MPKRGEQSAFTPVGQPRFEIEIEEVRASREAGELEGSLQFETMHLEIGRIRVLVSFEDAQKQPEPLREGQSRKGLIALSIALVIEVAAEILGSGLIDALRAVL